MKAPRADGVSWSRRRWLFWILAVVAGQAGLVFWLSDTRDSAPPFAVAQRGVRLLWSHGDAGRANSALERDDPTLFALVTTQGFSRSAWLGIPPRTYQITNRTEPWRWLTLPAEELCDDFAEFVETNLLSEEILAGRLTPSLAQPVPVAPAVVPSTTLRVEGGLADRSLLSNRPLPQQAEVVLPNSVVGVTVDDRGRTLSATLLSSSGSSKADQDALGFAKTLQFAPSLGASAGSAPTHGRLNFGHLVFQWSAIRWGSNLTTAAQQ